MRKILYLYKINLIDLGMKNFVSIVLRRLVLTILLVLFAVSSFAQLADKLKKLDKVSGVKELPVGEKMKSPFAEKVVMFVEQPIDHSNPSAGTFKQRVIVALADYNAPTVIVTEGYGAAYALRPNYREEVSDLLNTNMVVVEHRYFLESIPFMQQDSTITDETLNWDYMTAVNEAADLHNVNQMLRSVFHGKWIATGISKGGQTAMFYTAYYPNDLDVSVPYVGPLCKGVEDGRHEPFLVNYAGTQKDREIIKAFQVEFLKRRESIKPMFEQLSESKGYTYKMPMDAVYDFCVLEFPFAFWQWGLKTEIIPDPAKATDKQMFDFLLSVSGPDYFAEGDDSAPFFVQAAKELGYYGYDTKPFKGLLTIKDAKGYLNKIFVPQSQKFKFDKYLYKKIRNFLSTTDSKMMFIYGQYDPWSAVMPVAPVKNEELKSQGKGRETMKLYIQPNGSHRARIRTLPEQMQKEAINTLKDWLEIK